MSYVSLGNLPMNPGTDGEDTVENGEDSTTFGECLEVYMFERESTGTETYTVFASTEGRGEGLGFRGGRKDMLLTSRSYRWVDF